jgi:hypothetical protein
MNLRFPRHGAGGHEMTSAAGHAPAQEPSDGWLPPDSPLPVPDRACCCTARPMVKVIVPPSAARPHPVDLWLCGHHWRASRTALCAVGATACEMNVPEAEQAGRGTTFAAS